MNPRATSASPLSALSFSGRGASSRRLVQATLELLLVLVVMLPTRVAADEAKQVVKLDGEILFLPEVQLTKKINQITSFLYLGSWQSTARTRAAEKPLGTFDLENNNLTLELPGDLFEESRPKVVERNDSNSFQIGLAWGKQRVIQFAFKAISGRRQPAIMEIAADSDVTVFLNGKPACKASVDNTLAAGGRGYLPIMLEEGGNIISVTQLSRGEPRIDMTVRFDHTHDLQAAWQPQNGLLKKLVIGPKERAVADWNPDLGRFSVSAEVRDVAADAVVIQKKSLYRNMALDDAATSLAPGIYEAVYRTQNESASEYFILGNPREMFAEMSNKLQEYKTSPQTKLNIEAQLRRAQILLSTNNYNITDKLWQEKLAYTFSSLATMERRLKGGVTDIAKDQSGLHIRGFASRADDSFQSYRLFIPSTYKPGTPLPLLVLVSTEVVNTGRPFIEGPVMADHRGALLWAKYAEKHGFALLWPGYRGAPKGYTYESMHIDEAIHEVERDYAIDRQRISVYATCGAGYNAGRLISEYDRRFAAIVYDRAVFDFDPADLEQPSPSMTEWLKAISPVPHVLENKNLKIFVTHDNTRPPGHGEMELTNRFLAQAGKTRDDVVSYITRQPMPEASRMDMIFSWLAPCRNENPVDERSYISAKAGYAGPIMEIFTTPMIIVEGSHAGDNGREIMHTIAESIRDDYTKHFHGAECIVKKDVDVTDNDIKNHSLILIGNTMYNSVWEKLQPRIPLKISLDQALYKNQMLAKGYMFEAIVRHPDAPGKYILMIGTGDTKYLQPVITDNLFDAWYDCLVFSPSFPIISKLDGRADARSGK